MTNPLTRAAPKISLTTRSKDFLQETHAGIEKDVVERERWVEVKDHFERRRYCREFRRPQWPWPGSADIVLPVIDKAINTTKPRFMQMLLGDRPIQAFALDRESQKQSHAVELFAGHMVHGGAPGFREQLMHFVDDYAHLGMAIFKSFWAYERRPSAEHLTRSKLPPELRQLVVVASEREANRLAILSEQTGQNQAFLTPREFDARRDAVRQVLKDRLGWSDDDGASIDKVMTWLRGGAKDPITVMINTAFINSPAAVAVSPYNFIAPHDTTDVQNAERMVHRMQVNRKHLIRMAIDNGWDMKAVKEVIAREDRKSGGKSPQDKGSHAVELHEQSERERQHFHQTTTDTFELREVHTWFSSDEFGPMKKVKYTYHENHKDIPFDFKANTRPSGRFPFHVAKFENSSRRLYSSRGIPELLDDLDIYINMNHRAGLNRMQIVNSPSFAYRSASGFNPDNVRFTPGAFYPTQRPRDDIAPIPVPPMDGSEFQEERVLRTWAEEYIGSIDFGLSNPLSSLTEPRTAREINAITERAGLTSIIPCESFSMAVEELFDEWFGMWHTFGADEVWVAHTAAPPMRLTKKELAGNFRFQMAAGINHASPQQRAAKALTRLMILLQTNARELVEPQYELDIAEAIRDWMEHEDPRFVARVMRERTPEEIQQIIAERRRQEELAKKALTNQAQTPEELEEAIGILGQKAPNKKAQQIDVSGILRQAGA